MRCSNIHFKQIINQMKKLLILVVPVILAIGCHDYKADVDRLQKEKEAIAQSSNFKDSTITSFMGSFNEIENNLSAIEDLQARISESSKNNELKKTQVERIN